MFKIKVYEVGKPLSYVSIFTEEHQTHHSIIMYAHFESLISARCSDVTKADTLNTSGTKRETIYCIFILNEFMFLKSESENVMAP